MASLGNTLLDLLARAKKIVGSPVHIKFFSVSLIHGEVLGCELEFYYRGEYRVRYYLSQTTIDNANLDLVCIRILEYLEEELIKIKEKSKKGVENENSP